MQQGRADQAVTANLDQSSEQAENCYSDDQEQYELGRDLAEVSHMSNSKAIELNERPGAATTDIEALGMDHRADGIPRRDPEAILTASAGDDRDMSCAQDVLSTGS